MRIGQSATLLVLALLLTTAVAPAAAAPITYSEAASGDLGASLPAPTVFALDAGVNTVSGTLAFLATGLEQDSFAFSVPAGMQLTSVSFRFTTTQVGILLNGLKYFILDNGNASPVFPFSGSEDVDVLGASPVLAFTSALPLGAGIYGIFDNGGRTIGDSATPPPYGFMLDYTWSLTVAPTTAVPEPMSLLLFGTGLFGIAARRYRPRR